MFSSICFILLMQLSGNDIAFGAPNTSTLNFGPMIDIDCQPGQILDCNWFHDGKSSQVGGQYYRYSCTPGNATTYCSIFKFAIYQFKGDEDPLCWCQSTESQDIASSRHLSKDVVKPRNLYMKVQPEDSTIFRFLNVNLTCVFSEKVNCLWKHNGTQVTIGGNNLRYRNGGNGINTEDCSIEIMLPEEPEVFWHLESGIWSCENTLERPNAEPIVGAARLSLQECGRANELNMMDGKISGGIIPTRHKYPWIVGIHNSSKPWEYPMYVSLFCHGSLISKDWILTAAHCAFSNVTLGILRPINQLFISLGGHFLDESVIASTLVIREVCKVSVHPRYRFDYDVAMMKLTKSVTFSATISPICLPPPFVPITGQMVTVAGWGETKDTIKSLVLNEITIKVIPNLDCILLLNRKYVYITPRMLCAGQLSGKKDVCKGDSGSALIYKLIDRYIVVGIASFGIYDCNTPNAPKIFGRVTEFLPFINSNLQEKSCSKLSFS